MVNAIIKHSKVKTEMGVKSYELDPTNVGFERDHVLIGKRDVEDFERELILLANRYEHIMSHPDQIVKNPKSCFDWNRQCYYWDRCKRFNEEFEGEFKQRTPDYVEQHYIKILDIPTEKSEVTPCQSHPTQQDPGAMNATNSGPKITPTAQTAATSYDPPTNESK
jgi:hypothetical protein